MRYAAALPSWVLVTMIAACGDEPTGPTEEVALFLVTPAEITLMPGEPVLLQPQAQGFADTFTWTSSERSRP